MKNELPDGWKLAKLKDITECLDNKRVPLNGEERLKIQGNVPYYGANGQLDNINQYIFDEELLLVAEDGGSWGKKQICAYIIHGKSWVNNHAHVLRMKKDVEISFLMHCLNEADLNKYITGTTRGKLNRANMDKIEIPLPSLETQQKIITILEKAEETKKQRAQAYYLSQQLLQSVFLEMFGDPVRNPMGWEVRKLGELSTKILSGSTPKGGEQVYVKEGITFFRSQNVWKNRIEFSDIAFIDEATHNKMKKSSLKNKDILVTKTGRINTENSSLGRAALFLGENNSANINGHVYLIRLQENNIHKFILFILTTNAYRDYIRSVCVGGIDKRQINKHHLEEFPIIYPPLPLQEKFAEIVEQIEKTKQFQQQASQELDNLFNTLMQKAFNGELVS